MDLGYARVSTGPQDLTRQIETLRDAGIDLDHIWTDKRTGANQDRPGLTGVLAYARPGDRITVVTLDRLARNMRDTLNLIHQLTERGVGLRSLNDPIPVNTASDDAMARIAVLLLSLFAEMERVWNRERVASAREKAGKSPGRPRVLTRERVEMARKLQTDGQSIRAIAAALKVSKTTLGRVLAEQVSA